MKRIGITLSALVVLGAVGVAALAVSGLSEYAGPFGPDQTLLGFIYYAALFAFLGLVFLWAGLFVAYVIVAVVRTRS